jgi:hypothetical protein
MVKNRTSRDVRGVRLFVNASDPLSAAAWRAERVAASSLLRRCFVNASG